MSASRKGWIVFAAMLLLVLGLTSLPYVLAARAAGQGFVFGGFLFNPLDGNTYLAKMVEGWRGEWRFTLPYTADPGKGAYLFLFYIFLGHVAGWLNLPLLTVYHAARLLCSALMVLALYRFFVFLLPDGPARWLAFVLAALGSGLGWLAAMFGPITSDFWVAEAYPFLSAFAAPHFPFGLALALFLLLELETWKPGQGAGRAARILALSIILSIVSPFGVVIVLGVSAALQAWEWVRVKAQRGESATPERQFPMAGSFLLALLGGAPFLIYDLWVARADPILAGWNAQNLTPAPPVWDLLVSFSPALLVAAVGVWSVIQQDLKGGRLMVAWAAIGLLLLYAPLGLQRRFILGLFVPLAGLAALGLERLAAGSRRRFSRLGVLLLLLSVPTTWLVLLSAWHGIQTHDPLLYLTAGEGHALVWLEQNTPANALVLASPQTGLFIPAQTGRRVLYGHPFETVNAEQEKAAVTGYFHRGGASPTLLAQFPVDYVLVGPRELQLGEFSAPAGLRVAYQADGVTIYAVER